MRTTLTVPDLHLDVDDCWYYDNGGRHQDYAEAHFKHTEYGNVLIKVEVDGRTVVDENLSLGDSLKAYWALGNNIKRDLEVLPGLSVATQWRILDEPYAVDLTDHLEEITAWLKYACGLTRWEGSDEWQW